MDVKMIASGQKTVNAQITTEFTYYKGAILINASSSSTVVSISIHNCSAAGTPSATNMVAELSTISAPGDCVVDNPTGVIECPDGIRVTKSGNVRYHIRASAQPK